MILLCKYCFMIKVGRVQNLLVQNLDRLGIDLVCICPNPRYGKSFQRVFQLRESGQFRAVNSESGTRPHFLLVGIQERQTLNDVLVTEPCCKTLIKHQAGTQGWAAKRGEVSKMSKYGAPASQGGQVILPSIFEIYGLWGKHFQDFFSATMKQAEEYRGIPGAAISMHWRWRISFTLHKTMAEACSFNIRCLCNQTRISSSSRMALDQSPRQNPRAAACVELPLHLRDIWSLGQTLPRLLCIGDEAGGGVLRYPGSGHQHALAPENLLYSA